MQNIYYIVMRFVLDREQPAVIDAFKIFGKDIILKPISPSTQGSEFIIKAELATFQLCG